MKAITVIQPWASLLATGKKHCETRSWKTNYRGEILIHASKRPTISGFILMSDLQRKTAREALGIQANDYDFKDIPTGAIIGKANLVNCVEIDQATRNLIREQHPDEYNLGDFTPGRYAWVMEDPVLFQEPIQVAGKQGLWNYDLI